jgi:hypothetical protein
MYDELYEDDLALFENASKSRGISEVVKIKYLTYSKAKEIGIVTKANDREKYLNGVDVFIILNGDVFDSLEEKHKNMVVDRLLSQISFNDAKNKIELVKPDIKGNRLYFDKYGYQNHVELEDLIKLIFEQKKETEVE